MTNTNVIIHNLICLVNKNEESSLLLPARFAMFRLVGARGFEPPTPRSRTVCATRLRYAPKKINFNISINQNVISVPGFNCIRVNIFFYIR